MVTPALPDDSPLPPDVLAGQAVYSDRVLSLYDWLVLGVSNRWVWRCATSHIRDLFDQHVTAAHLDVGVGTGYFLDHCRFPVEAPRVALMDLNQSCLDRASGRIARYAPRTYRRNVLQPIPFDEEPFDSISLNYLLHCLPGALPAKAVVFDHLLPLLKPGGVMFGSTLLSGEVERSRVARWLMEKYNRRGIFANAEDSRSALEAELQSRFTESHVQPIGCAALFWARKG